MGPLDARQRPSARVSDAKALRCVGGAYVVFMVRAAGIHLAKITRPGGTVCGRGNGSRPGQRSTSWCERPERLTVWFRAMPCEVITPISCYVHTTPFQTAICEDPPSSRMVERLGTTRAKIRAATKKNFQSGQSRIFSEKTT